MRRSTPGFTPLLAGLAAAAAVIGCSTVPETGRKQLNFMSPQTEAEMGFQAFSEYKRSNRVAAGHPGNAQLQRVGRRISRVVEVPYSNWEYVLFDDKTPNAFALPGGKIGVNTGILPITKNDAGLATIIGHEIGHVSARHGAERMSQGTLAAIGGAAAAIALGQSDLSPGARTAVLSAYGAGTGVGMLKFSRNHEYEADRLGMLYMARAGYDPREAVAFWKRFAAHKGAGGARLPEFLSTHPLDDNRIRALESHLPEAMAVSTR